MLGVLLAWLCNRAAAQLALLLCVELWCCGAAGVLPAWLCDRAAAQRARLVCVKLGCCGAVVAAVAGDVTRSGAAGVADARSSCLSCCGDASYLLVR